MKTKISNKNEKISGLLAGSLMFVIFILLRISGNQKKEISFVPQEISNKSYVSSSIGTAAVLHTKRENHIFIFDGYGAAKTEEDNKSKEVKWIMKGEDVCYEVVCKLYDIQNDLQITGIKESKKGFYCEIDLTTIKDGEYESFLWIVENEKDYALVDLDFDFYKNGSETGMLTPSLSNNILDSREGELIFSLGESLDFSFIEDYYLVRGCAYIPEKDSQFTKIYLDITDAEGNHITYPFKIRYSAWAEENLGQQYAWFDISIILSEDQIPKTDITLKVIAENNGVYTAYQKMVYLYQEGIYTKES